MVSIFQHIPTLRNTRRVKSKPKHVVPSGRKNLEEFHKELSTEGCIQNGHLAFEVQETGFQSFHKFKDSISV